MIEGEKRMRMKEDKFENFCDSDSDGRENEKK